MKLGRKLPYGVPVIVTALCFAGLAFALGEETNPGYGFIGGKVGNVIIFALAGVFAALAVVFLINSIFVEKELSKEEKDREKEYRDANNRYS